MFPPYHTIDLKVPRLLDGRQRELGNSYVWLVITTPGWHFLICLRVEIPYVIYRIPYTIYTDSIVIFVCLPRSSDHGWGFQTSSLYLILV